MKKYCILTDKKKVLLQFKLDKKDRHRGYFCTQIFKSKKSNN